MAQHRNIPRPANGRANLYQDITDQIIDQLEAGHVPWVQPWSSVGAGLGMPFNAATGRQYSGVNILTLWSAVVRRGFDGHGFLTFRQAIGLGGAVRRGEAGTTVVYAHVARDRPVRSQDNEDQARRGVPFLKRFTVFAVEQCEGLPETVASPPPVPSDALILPQADALIKATGARFRIGGASAYYSPGADTVVVPPPQTFHEPINWHRTAFHELSHWTGHVSRLNRDQSGIFGSKAYGREELVAEMAGAFVCASLGIAPTVRHADYIGDWLEIIREDNRAVVRAASAASKAANFLLAFGDAGADEQEAA
jgi:antirestriction protein ArdC